MLHQCKLISTITLVSAGRTLLVKYADMPDHQRGWFVPHVLMAALEHPTDAAVRAAREQADATIDSPELRNVESFKGRDGTWHLCFHHLAQLPAPTPPPPSNIVTDAQWFDIDALPARDQVAHHGWAIDTIQTVMSRK
ncbi:MAG: NUDIX hydrolase [Tepidisphaeraceae bacterium]